MDTIERARTMHPQIVDVRIDQDSDESTAEGDMRQQIIDGLSKPPSERTLPTTLLYSEEGLKLYDAITVYADEYYLFGAEEQILRDHAAEIVDVMHQGRQEGEVVVELGAGALRKTAHILRALAGSVPTPQAMEPITYYALDLEKPELDRTLKQVMDTLGPELRGKVSAQGMWGTYDSGIQYIRNGGLTPPLTPSEDSEDIANPDQPVHFLFLGSSLGNFNRQDDVPFLRSLPLRAGSFDTLLIGLDGDNGAELVNKAYDDRKGYTRDFIMHGLKVAGAALGDETLFATDKWEYVSCYNEELHCHESYYRSKVKQTIQDPDSKQTFTFLPDELINVEVSHKYSDGDAYRMFTEANLRPIQRWQDTESRYSLWLVERPPFNFPLLKAPKNATTPFGTPDQQEFIDMWAAWDFITLQMVPKAMLHEKPIDLRHKCLFYLGHIPAFLDIHMSRLLNEPFTEPAKFTKIFERGIDPNVNDPTKCHPHSEVPTRDEDWPLLDEVLQYRTRVRSRVLRFYDDIADGKQPLTRKAARVLQMTLEHEIFHAETLLYMLLQRGGTGTVPPPGFVPPLWDTLASQWDAAPVPKSEIVTLGPTTISLGHDDPELEDAQDREILVKPEDEFGWDNEHPKREVQVPEFRISWRPITNGEFYEFYTGKGKGQVCLPASWAEVEGETRVRTMYGPIPMRIARHWPVLTTYDDLSTYAQVKGGRLPTETELRLFLDKFESGYEGGANVGFRNWHPVPATTGGEKNGGKGTNGGVWEWTSTVFGDYPGYVPSKIYPGYSTDFFDNEHQVVLGGSYVTAPRLAGRRTARNYYQHNYPYAWAGARIAYDALAN